MRQALRNAGCALNPSALRIHVVVKQDKAGAIAGRDSADFARH